MITTKALDPLALPLGGLHFVEASAGTGKTHAIASLYIRLVLEGGLGVDRILVVTFTRSATAELHDRLRDRLWTAVSALEQGGAPEDPFLDALVRSRQDREGDRRRLLAELRRFDEASISTIHGFCGRVLGDHAFESGVPFDARLATEDEALLAEVAQDFWTQRLATAEPELVRLLSPKRLAPRDLLALAKMASATQELVLLPPAGPDGLDEALGRARAAFEALRARWPGDREVVEAFVLRNPGLKGNHFTKGSHARRLGRAEALLGPGARLPLSLERDWTCFSPAAVAAATKKGFVPPEHPFFEGVGALAQAVEALDGAVDRRVLSLQRRFLEEARGEVRRRKAEAGVLSFDDLLLLLDEALAGPGGDALIQVVRRRWGAALIDEFQDTDPIQYRIFRRLFTGDGTSLFLIGDPKQAIYGFRGADIFAYLRAAREAGEERHTLDTNWRSDPPLIAAVNRIFSGAARPFLLEDIPFTAVSPRPGATAGLQGPLPFSAPFELLFVSSAFLGADATPVPKGWVEARLPALVAAEIARLLSAEVERPSDGRGGGEPIGPGDVAVLVRSNRQGARIQAALRAIGLPSVLHSEASVFDTSEAAELSVVLGALAQPAQLARLRRALATDLVGLGALGLLALGEDEARLEGWIETFRRFAALHSSRGFLPAFTRLFTELDVPARLLWAPGGERRLTNFMHLGELLHLASRRQRLGLEGLVSWLAQARRGAPLEGITDRDARQVRVESDDRAVQVLTLHKCKGLEFPVVYCPYLWGGDQGGGRLAPPLTFHDPAAGGRRTIDLGSGDLDASLRRVRWESLAEGLRLAYVGLTRARHRCTVLWGPFGGVGQSALGYLLHQGMSGAGARGEDELWEQVSGRIGELGEDGMKRDLGELAAGSGGAIVVREPDSGPAAYEPRRAGVEQALSARTFRGVVDRRYHLTSFTALVSGSAPALGPAQSDGLDRDELAVVSGPPPVAQEGAPPAAAQGGRADAVEIGPAMSADMNEDTPVPLADFPRGPRAGNLLHHLLETLDFAEGPQARRAHVRRALGRFGVEADRWEGILSDAAGHWLAHPLPAEDGLPIRLGALPPGARRAELEFVLPVAEGADRTRVLLTPARLAMVFAAFGAGDPLLASYAGRLSRIVHLPLHGFLRGFVDLVFTHEGRYYLIDWKSNHLGPSVGDYAPARLGDVMVAEHYVLQCHLYLVALHRHLQARLPSYDYDRHMGAAYYLFLRGIVPGGPAEAGIFRDRPSRALVEALSEVLDGGAGPAPGRGGSHG